MTASLPDRGRPSRRTSFSRPTIHQRAYHASRHRLSRFVLVGLSGFVVNTVALAMASGSLGLHYLVGALIATTASTSTNFVLTDAWVFDDRVKPGHSGFRSMVFRFAIFLGLSLATLVVRGPILVLLIETVSLHYLVANALSLLALMMVRYRFAGSFIWPEAAND